MQCIMFVFISSFYLFIIKAWHGYSTSVWLYLGHIFFMHIILLDSVNILCIIVSLLQVEDKCSIGVNY